MLCATHRAWRRETTWKLYFINHCSTHSTTSFQTFQLISLLIFRSNIVFCWVFWIKCFVGGNGGLREIHVECVENFMSNWNMAHTHTHPFLIEVHESGSWIPLCDHVTGLDLVRFNFSRMYCKETARKCIYITKCSSSILCISLEIGPNLIKHRGWERQWVLHIERSPPTLPPTHWHILTKT